MEAKDDQEARSLAQASADAQFCLKHVEAERDSVELARLHRDSEQPREV